MNSLGAGFNFFSLIHIWCYNDGNRRQGFIQKIDHRNMTQDELINTVNLLEGIRALRTQIQALSATFVMLEILSGRTELQKRTAIS